MNLFMYGKSNKINKIIITINVYGNYLEDLQNYYLILYFKK